MRPKCKTWGEGKLKSEETKQEFQNRVYNGVIDTGIDLKWEEKIKNIRQSAEELIGFSKLNPKKP